MLSSILAFLRALPIIAEVFNKLVDGWDAYKKRKVEETAAQRKDEKDSAVDRAVTDAVNGVPKPTGETGQQQAPDAKD